MKRFMRQRGATAAASAGVALLLLASLVPTPAAADDAAPPDLIDLITVENRTTDAFGGGNQLVVRVGNDAFGVVYGGEGDQAGYVTFYAAVVRTLGTADVYESASGRLVAQNVPLPVVTVVAERMLGVVEFRDTNGQEAGPGDGIFNYRPNLTTPDVLDFNASEPLIKSLELRGTWSLTDFALRADGPDAANVTYTLTLADVPYTHPGDPEWAGDGQVDAVAFHVKLQIQRSKETVQEVPHYDATVTRTRDGRQLTAIDRDGQTPHNATVTRASMKVDHEIVGWDPAPVVHDAPTRLLLLTAIPVMNGFSQALAPWINDLVVRGERAPTAQVERAEGDDIVISEDQRGADTFVHAQGIALRDGWRQMGSVAFDPTVQVWGPDSQQAETGRAYFQVIGGARIADRVDGNVFRGFVLMGGFSYPAAYRVYHDPQVVAEGFEFSEVATLPAFQPTGAMAAQVGLIVASVGAAVALSAYFVSSRARARQRAARERFEALRDRYELPPGGGAP